MKKIIISSLAVATLFATQSCKTDFDTDVADIKVEKGSADFSKYISVGNSLTAGYRDGALYTDGQKESLPSIIAQQMKLAGGGEFKQPMMADNLGGIASVGFLDKLQLVVTSDGRIAPYRSNNIQGTTTLANIYNQGPYQNMGVPGAKSFHLLAPGYGSAAALQLGLANPYYVRFSSSATASVIEDTMSQNPTFFSLWIGNNDVLGYATSGGDGSDPITSTAVFTQSYNTLVNTLTGNGAKGVIANIPNVTSLPFFTTVPYNPVRLDENLANLLNNELAPLKAVLSALGQGDRLQTLAAGNNNPLLIKDETLTDLSAQITGVLNSQGVPPQLAGVIGTVFGQARHTTNEDLVLISTGAVIGTSPGAAYDSTPFNKYGITYPLEDKHVLTKTEVNEVITATEAFNQVIQDNAESHGLAFVDMNAKMIELAQNSGINYDGVRYTTKFVTGGTFSLDGVHLTGRGYAVTANYFIEAINKQYDSTLPLVEANKYSGLKFP